MMSPVKAVLRCAGKFHIARKISILSVSWGAMVSRPRRSDIRSSKVASDHQIRVPNSSQRFPVPRGRLTLETTGKTNGGGRYEIGSKNSVTSRTSAPTVVRKGIPFLSGLLVDPLNPDYFSSDTISGADVIVEPRLPVPTRV